MAGGAVERRWIAAELDEDCAQALAEQTGHSLRLCRMMVRRGVETPEAAERYLKPQLSHMPHPHQLKGCKEAAVRLADAIEAKQKLTLYGDYDVDGVTSTALLASFLAPHGLLPEIYIPKRLKEGYGLNRQAVEAIAESGADLMITLDCGITAADEIALANERGVEVIVVDHHKCPPELPQTVATLNPHQDDCPYPEKVLAAVGVCFNLLIATRIELRERGFYGPDRMEEPNLRRSLDLVALGTIADMVNLTGVNRVLAWYGMQEIRWARRPGLRALMEVSKVKANKADSSSVGFRLGPRINAAGRLADATIGVRLLLAEDIREARRMAQALDDANGNRQRIEADVFESAVKMVEDAGELPPILVLAEPTWHPGVVGIVASKLVERYDRPTILIGEGGRGSARTAKGVHIYNAMNDCSGHLVKFGGHRAAAGLRIHFEKVEDFRQALEQRVAEDPDYGQNTESILIYDEALPAEELNELCWQEAARLEPYGNGNSEPLFMVSKLKLRSSRVVGKDHLKLQVEGPQGQALGAIAFKMGEHHPELKGVAQLEAAVHLERNEWQGVESLELRVRDLRY